MNATVEYRLRMPEPHAHLFDVEVRVTAPAGGVLELVMPSWTPGSYLLREFARNVQDFSAHAADGPVLPWRKVDKGRWRVDAAAGAEVVAHYRVYANELSVRTSHLDASHGYVNGASVFMYVEGRQRAEHRVHVEAPAGWRTTTALPAANGAPDAFVAVDYDTLVDAPFEIGTHALHEWEIDGVPHRYAVWGRGNLDLERLVRDTTAVVRAGRELFGSIPYPAFTFILHLATDGRGGLEHRDSTSLLVDRWAFEGKAYESVIALVAHEHHHAWNGKRIRPAALGPFDYTRESYTRELWVMEGLTTYYTELLLRRAGLVSAERFLERLAEQIARLRVLPGRHVQSVAESSFDTWIKFYRPDANSPNAQISYYHKGALVGLLLDLMIRTRSGNARSLDDVMRLLWRRWGEPDVGYPEGSGPGSARAIVEEVYGAPLGDFFAATLDGTEELDFDPVLAAAGLALAATEAPSSATAVDPLLPESRLGVRVRADGGRTVVVHVLAGTPAHRGGVNAGDELVALDGFRVQTATLAARLAATPAGEPLPLMVFRRDELLALSVELGETPRPAAALRPAPGATAEQRALLADWLRGPAA